MSLSIRASFALAALTAAAFSSAAQQVQTINYGPSTTNWDALLNFDKFDGSKGTLTGYTLVFTWTGTLSGTVTNLSASSNAVSIDHSLQFDLSDSGYTTYYMTNNTVLSTTYTKTLAAAGSQGSSGSYGPISETPGSNTFSVNNLGLSFFMGSGVTDLDLYAHAETTQGYNGPIQADVDTMAGVTATLTYDYTPSGSTPAVPAPPAFMAMGLGALRLARRRRGARA